MWFHLDSFPSTMVTIGKSSPKSIICTGFWGVSRVNTYLQRQQSGFFAAKRLNWRDHGSLNVPMFHITQSIGINGLLDGYFFRCPIAPSHGTVTPTPGDPRSTLESLLKASYCRRSLLICPGKQIHLLYYIISYHIRS